ncbi:MAG: hypothetical protein V4592_01905 [Bacteroidota bacterium]
MNILFPFKSSILTGALLLFSHCHSDKALIPQNSVKDTVRVSNPGNESTPPIIGTPLKNMFGINSYEWDFLQNPNEPNTKYTIYEANMALIKSFSGFRHYMNWNKPEWTEGNYTFNPTNDGSWDYDLIYTRCKQEGITVLIDLKNCPNWMAQSYPSAQQDDENVPALYNADLSKPASYVQQARVGFQLAARYGYNTAVDKSLVKVDPRPRWANDHINEVKIGMGLVKYIECNNEEDRWWKGPLTTQTPEQYAANLSAFYDGDKGKLGTNAGIKTADPNMIVVMGGLASCDPTYVTRIIDWCKANRGYKADGNVNLCFDVINYHYYSNNGDVRTHKQASTGVAPELSDAGSIADGFLTIGKQYNVPVWVTEAGYDINQGSYQKAIAIGAKSVLLTQADWILRTALLYSRHGVQSLYYYQLFDVAANSPTQYATAGMAEGTKRRPAADYILQTTKLMGNYTYSKTINADPLVDVYVSGKKTMYVLTVPDQKGRTALYNLDLGATTTSTSVYKPTAGADAMTKTTGITVAGKLNVTVTETPIFIEGPTAP